MTESPDEALRRGREADLRERLAALTDEELAWLGWQFYALVVVADKPATKIPHPVRACWHQLARAASAEHRARQEGDAPLLGTRLRDLDRALGGFVHEGHYVLAAETLRSVADDSETPAPAALVLRTCREWVIDAQRAARRTRREAERLLDG